MIRGTYPGGEYKVLYKEEGHGLRQESEKIHLSW